MVAQHKESTMYLNFIFLNGLKANSIPNGPHYMAKTLIHNNTFPSWIGHIFYHLSTIVSHIKNYQGNYPRITQERELSFCLKESSILSQQQCSTLGTLWIARSYMLLIFKKDFLILLVAPNPSFVLAVIHNMLLCFWVEHSISLPPFP